MTTLIEFLRTRYDEEQRDAEAAYDGDGYREWDIPCTGVVQVAGGDLDGLVVAPRNAAIHIACHDPARVLAEVAAKRAIIADCTEMLKMCQVDRGGNLGRPGEHMMGDFGRWILQKMAAPYAAHPDYNPAWQPAEVTT
jgi:hypothetical protein